MRRPEQEVLPLALRALEGATGLAARIETTEPARPKGADAVVRIVHNAEEWAWPVAIKTAVTNAALGAVAEQIRRLGPRGLLVARYITPPQAERLRELDIPFIDTAGNAYLNHPPLYVLVTGRRAVTPATQPRMGRLERPAALRVLFALLCRPELPAEPLRAIAHAANVALGTAQEVLALLAKQGYIAGRRRARRLTPIKRDALLQRWAAAYPEALRPKLLIGRYAAPAPEWWRDLNPPAYGALWGGEVAAARLTGYLKPGTVTIYIGGTPGRLLLDNRLKTDPAGDVEILQRFWRFQVEGATVPPLLVYADLLAIGDTRTVEAAQLVYERWLVTQAQNA